MKDQRIVHQPFPAAQKIAHRRRAGRRLRIEKRRGIAPSLHTGFLGMVFLAAERRAPQRGGVCVLTKETRAQRRKDHLLRKAKRKCSQSLLGGARVAACGLISEGAMPLRCIPKSLGWFLGQPNATHRKGGRRLRVD
jgi:hypothetical protein